MPTHAVIALLDDCPSKFRDHESKWWGDRISPALMNTLAHDHPKTVENQADINRKLTPPEVDADIALAQDTRKHVIVIKCKNRIPFRADWRINTTKN